MSTVETDLAVLEAVGAFYGVLSKRGRLDRPTVVKALRQLKRSMPGAQNRAADPCPACTHNDSEVTA